MTEGQLCSSKNQVIFPVAFYTGFSEQTNRNPYLLSWCTHLWWSYSACTQCLNPQVVPSHHYRHFRRHLPSPFHLVIYWRNLSRGGCRQFSMYWYTIDHSPQSIPWNPAGLSKYWLICAAQCRYGTYFHHWSYFWKWSWVVPYLCWRGACGRCIPSTWWGSFRWKDYAKKTGSFLLMIVQRNVQIVLTPTQPSGSCFPHWNEPWCLSSAHKLVTWWNLQVFRRIWWCWHYLREVQEELFPKGRSFY